MGKERKSRKESKTAEAEAAMSLRAILFVCIGARGGEGKEGVLLLFFPRGKKGGLRKKRRKMSYISGKQKNVAFNFFKSKKDFY